MTISRAILISLALLFAATSALSATPRAFESEAGLFAWAENYYRAPEPDRLPEAARFLHERLVFEAHPERYWPMSMFFGGAYANSPSAARAGADQAAASDDPFMQSFLLSALWASNDAFARSQIDRVAGSFRDERIVELLEHLKETEPFLSTDETPSRPVHVAMLWGRFHATGEREVVDLIIEALRSAGGTELERRAAEAARASLAERAKAHGGVARTIDERLEREQDASIRGALEKIAAELRAG